MTPPDTLEASFMGKTGLWTTAAACGVWGSDRVALGGRRVRGTRSAGLGGRRAGGSLSCAHTSPRPATNQAVASHPIHVPVTPPGSGRSSAKLQLPCCPPLPGEHQGHTDGLHWGKRLQVAGDLGHSGRRALIAQPLWAPPMLAGVRSGPCEDVLPGASVSCSIELDTGCVPNVSDAGKTELMGQKPRSALRCHCPPWTRVPMASHGPCLPATVPPRALGSHP